MKISFAKNLTNNISENTPVRRRLGRGKGRRGGNF
jgi:hypothetical protein